MIIYVVSYIPYLNHIKDKYEVENDYTLEQFIKKLGIDWDEEALVVVNKDICMDKERHLKSGDKVELLLPISGG